MKKLIVLLFLIFTSCSSPEYSVTQPPTSTPWPRPSEKVALVCYNSITDREWRVSGAYTSAVGWYVPEEEYVDIYEDGEYIETVDGPQTIPVFFDCEERSTSPR